MQASAPHASEKDRPTGILALSAIGSVSGFIGDFATKVCCEGQANDPAGGLRSGQGAAAAWTRAAISSIHARCSGFMRTERRQVTVASGASVQVASGKNRAGRCASAR